MLFCEALGGWHIALLIAKVSYNSINHDHKLFDISYIWIPEQAQAVIDKQFEAYFSRRLDTEAAPELINVNNQDEIVSKPSNVFSLEDLVVVANISGCLHNALVLKVNIC